MLGGVNLMLFESADTAATLPRTDRRARHLLGVLRRQVGGEFDAGVVNGPRGKGTLIAVRSDEIDLELAWSTPTPPLDPVTLLVGLPRPQTARDILREATALGVGALHFFSPEKGEASYARSSLWTSGEWRRLLVSGAEQAFDTRLPEVTHGRGLAEIVAQLPAHGSRIAFDNYESPRPLSATTVTAPVILAFGPERGWSAGERGLLRAKAFDFAHLGTRVLRSETAVIAAVSLVKTRLGLL
ncbi:MAG: rRNA methyltransferase [Verrucomicrobia bacterium]|nr:rRNA methyltransferase [Verrucomicrobiota bacterium]